MRPEEIMKAVNSPLFHDCDIITEELVVGLHMLKPRVVIYIGQAGSRLVQAGNVYPLYYSTIKAPGPLLAGDTDSFFLELLKVRRQQDYDLMASSSTSTINSIAPARDRVFVLWKVVVSFLTVVNLLNSFMQPI